MIFIAIRRNRSVIQNDKIREWEIKSMGLTVMRFSTDEVTSDINNVLEKIVAFLENVQMKSNYNPSLQGGREGSEPHVHPS